LKTLHKNKQESELLVLSLKQQKSISEYLEIEDLRRKCRLLLLY